MNWKEDGKLTIVVPIHGQIDKTMQFLDCFERQTEKCHLIFVDDRSPDDSVAAIRKRGYEVYVPDDRLWFNGALQKAIDECKTPLLGFLNNDIFFGKNFVRDVIASFETSGYDFLVPTTVDIKEYDYVDRDREHSVDDLLVREGWSMFMRVEKMRLIPKIPTVFRLLFGDDWITYYSWRMGYLVGKMKHVFIVHDLSSSISGNPGNSNPVIEADYKAFEDNFTWLRRRRKRPEVKDSKRYSVDPASGKLLEINLRTKDSNPSDVCKGDGWPTLPVVEPKDFGSVVLVVPHMRVHSRFIDRFKKTVERAWAFSKGPFSSMKIEFVEDDSGRGAGWGRNVAIERNPDADWFFFVDVDDLPKPYCFEAMNRSTTDAVWGVIEHRFQYEGSTFMVVDERSFGQYEWELLVQFGHRGGSGLNTAFFLRGSVARKYRWFENTPVFEDIEYFIITTSDCEYERLPFPLVTIDKTVRKPTDGGTVNPKEADFLWYSVMDFWQRHGRNPLVEEVVQYRNSADTMKAFYG